MKKIYESPKVEVIIVGSLDVLMSSSEDKDVSLYMNDLF